MAFTASFPNLGPRLTVLDSSGQQHAAIDFGPPGLGPGRMVAPHGIAVDSRGDVYIGEVSYSAWPGTFPQQPPPERIPSLHKLSRIG
jgi:hypothetical protein